MKLIPIIILTTLASAAAKPNILFLLSDDQHWNGLSVAMHPELENSKSHTTLTPTLEKLATEGMRFSAAYAPAPVCSPTRISLQTGMTNARLQWTKASPVDRGTAGYALLPPNHRKSIREDETTVAEMLKTAGYATAHYGKWHLSGGGPEKHGYDESDGDTGNEVASRFKGDNPVDIVGMGTRAAAFMEKSQQAGKPFFIQMSYHALHSPGNANPKTLQACKERLSNAPDRIVQRAAIAQDLDSGVGELLKTLDTLGLADNTWVIYLSDNGGGGGGKKRGSQSIQGGKGSLWEGGIRVPLIIRAPGIKANSWCHERVTGYDLFNTFCEIAGVEKPLPDELDGGSIVALCKGTGGTVARPRRELVFHFPHYQGDTPHSAIYLDDYKLIKFYETNQLKLFNIRKDIGETTDLSQQLPEKAAELDKRLAAYLIEVDAQLPTKNPRAIAGKTYDPRSAKGPPPGSGKRERRRPR